MTHTSKGDCECCTATNVQLTLSRRGNMMQCKTCRETDEMTRTNDAKNVIELSRKVDSTIQVKKDIFEKMAISFVELQAAINNNGEIPADRKDYALLEEMNARYETLKQAIFDAKSTLVTLQNEQNALLHNAQSVVAKLREADRAKFKQFDINYQPAPVKKPKTVKAARPTYKMSEVKAAADKYKVPAPQVQSIILSKNLNPEEAAKYMANLMGLI